MIMSNRSMAGFCSVSCISDLEQMAYEWWLFHCLEDTSLNDGNQCKIQLEHLSVLALQLCLHFIKQLFAKL